MTHCLLEVSGGVDCGRRRRNVYDKKPQHYTKDNRTAHLTARSDKPVAYVTNNKRLFSTFCTVEANYWQTWSIARPLCDSRATCLLYFLVSWAWWDWPLTWLTGNHCPSLLWHCSLGYLTCKIVLEMTYIVLIATSVKAYSIIACVIGFFCV